jgi:hypothetical protein
MGTKQSIGKIHPTIDNINNSVINNKPTIVETKCILDFSNSNFIELPKHIKVNIQNLEKKPNNELFFLNVYDEDLKNYNGEYFKRCRHNTEKHLTFSENFIGAFLTAYNIHGDVFINPDDIWIMIMFFVSKYINENSEAIRSNFVDHYDKKELIITEYNNDPDAEKNWEIFFTEIEKMINISCKGNIVDKFKSNFSTTDDFYNTVLVTLTMDSLQKYFSYGRMVCACGINNVYFGGEKDDWIKLSNKVLELNELDVGNNVMKTYVYHVKIILDKFVDSINGQIDVDFWNTIISSEIERIGSGGEINTNICGWILHFLGIYSRVSFEDLQARKTNVSIKLNNQNTNKVKDLILETKFDGVVELQPYIFAPNLSISIKEKNDKKTKPFGFMF